MFTFAGVRCSILVIFYYPTMAEAHEERFIPTRQKLNQISLIDGYSAVPRLEYR